MPPRTPARHRSHDLEARVAELEHALARAERTAAALREVGLALGAIADLDQLLELILSKTTELLEADRATLYLLDEPRGVLSSRMMVGAEARSIELPVGEGIAGWVAKSGRTIRVRDAYRDRRFQREWDVLTGYRTRSILAAPMKNHVGRTIGVIQLLNKRTPAAKGGVASGERLAGEFTTADEELLLALATQAAIAIDNSRLFLSVITKNMQLSQTKEQLEHRVRDLKLLFDLESAMAHAGSIDELVLAVLGEAAKACQARAGAILLAEGGELFLYVVDVAQPRTLRTVSLAQPEGLLGWALRHNEAVVAPDVRVDDRYSRRIEEILGFTLRSVIAAPLEGEGETPLGAMGLYTTRGGRGFGPEDRSLLRLVCANASTAIQLFRSRAARERSQRLTTIGSLLSGVMHDLRTPLTVISGYVQLMARARDEGARREHAEHILRQFDLIAAMQREVLEFARGERNVLIRKVYLSRLFGELGEHLQREVAGRRIRVVIELDDRGTARLDETKMMRVFHNLARNAFDAMGEEGTLTVRVSREGGELLIVFADTGPGIPPEIQGRIFQSFVTGGRAGGTGLGLAIVKKIVEEHGGTVSAESTSRGATFTLRIPQKGTVSLPARPRR